jgi:release factor glutamine methyltransferase
MFGFMKIRDAEKELVEALADIYDESESRNIAQLVLEACTGYTHTEILLQREATITPEQVETVQAALLRLQQHEPVQYVLNRAWFYGMELYVDKNVLIPRPETEELVDWVVIDLKRNQPQLWAGGPAEADKTSELKILDVGTGSGCIALALKKTIPAAEVWGCDVSEEPLNVARRNGASLDVRVDFQGIDFLDVSQHRLLPTVDIILSNPPYIPLRDKGSMRRNVLDFEPHTALFVPDDDALLFYRAIVQFAAVRLYEGGAIYLEIHEDLAAHVAALFRNSGYRDVEIKKDMQGKERMVRVASPAGESPAPQAPPDDRR